MSKRLVALFVAVGLAIAALAVVSSMVYAQSTVLSPTMTSVSVGTGGTLAALAANPTRKALTICNEHATQTVTFTFGGLSPVSLTTGRVLAAGNLVTSCFTAGSITGPVGPGSVGAAVNLIASGASTPVTLIEYY